MNRIPAIALIALGSALEVFYYHMRFRQDGSEWWLSFLIAIALTLFLAILTIMRKNWWAIVLMILLGAYSVFSTAAGQRFSLGIVLEQRAESEATQEIAREAIEEYRQNVARLNREEEQLLSATDGLTLRERANFRTYGIMPIEERKGAIAQERREWQEKIDAERSRLTTHREVEQVEMNIYTFYGNLFGLKSENVQVFLQVALSIFIALMAPAGIIMIQTVPRQERLQEAEETEPVDNEYKEQARKWAELSWHGIRKGRLDRLIDIVDVQAFAQSRNFNTDLYKKILDDSKRNGIIGVNSDGHHVPLVSENEAIAILCGGHHDR